MKPTEWKRVSLGEHCEVFSGYPFQSSGFTDDPSDIALVKGENIGQGEILWSISKRWPYSDAAELKRFMLQPGDVVLAMDRPWVPAGLKFARIPESAPDALLVQRVARFRAKHGLTQEVLPYLISSPAFVAYVQNTGRGVGVPHISGREIERFRFPLPPKNAQRSIAAVLSNYDDLIENNRRRMALLEEAARQLYEEWFVRLRFPGHEGTRMINGVPEGWEQVPLGERVTLNYGKALKAEDRVDGPFPVYGSSGIVGGHDKALTQGPGIILGRKGNIGSVFWSSRDFYAIDTVYYADAETSNLYLFYALRHMHFISTDAAVPGLNRELAYSIPLLVPSGGVFCRFLEVVSPIHEEVDKLGEMSKKLKAARDLLLPRLMSGEIAV